jgi:dihydrolipoamide dehydrogenase
VVKDVEALEPQQKIRGRARFVEPTALEVVPVDGGDPLRIEAKAVVIATGSSSWAPPVLAGAGDRLLHNDDVFELESLPKSMAIIGTGIIGIELGQALHRLGVRTSFFTIDDMIGPMTDPAVKGAAQEIFRSELDLHLEVKITAVERTEQGIRIAWTDPAGESHDAEYQQLLAATGRRPNVADLGLEHAAIELDPKGLPLFDPSTMQCGDAPVFIAGDANNQRPLLHEASDEGQIAGANAARYPAVEQRFRRFPLAIVFSDPQMAIVGPSHAELTAAGTDFEAGEVDYGGQGRARVMGKNAGLVRVYGEHPSGRFLGAEMLGPRVEHTAHLLAWAGQQQLSVDQMLALPFYHPVVEEGLRTALRDVAAKLRKRS